MPPEQKEDIIMNSYDENDVAAIYETKTTALTTPFKLYSNHNDTIIDLEAATTGTGSTNNNQNSIIHKTMNDTNGSCNEQQQQQQQQLVFGTTVPVPGTSTTKISQRPSNEYVLNVAFFTFVIFLTIQAIFAIRAHSQAMIADSQAMSVDAITYLFNLVAERMKHIPLTKYEQSLSPTVCNYNRLVRKLYLELIPPTISVITLIIVTIYTLQKSTHILLGIVDINNTTVQETVSVSTMLLFSIINLVLDIVNVSCFARSNSLFGLGMIHQEQNTIHTLSLSTTTSCCPTSASSSSSVIETTSLLSKQHAHSHHHHHHHEDLTSISPNNKKSESIKSTETTSLMKDTNNSYCCGVCGATECTTTSDTSNTSYDINLENNYGSLLEPCCGDCEASKVIHFDDDRTVQQPTSFMSNLNMCSAWTHICADTLRSTAVLVAAAIAVLVPNVDGIIADSVAAIVVSIIIFFSLLPLLQGLVVTTLEIIQLHRNPPPPPTTTTNKITLLV